MLGYILININKRQLIQILRTSVDGYQLVLIFNQYQDVC